MPSSWNSTQQWSARMAYQTARRQMRCAPRIWSVHCLDRPNSIFRPRVTQLPECAADPLLSNKIAVPPLAQRCFCLRANRSVQATEVPPGVLLPCVGGPAR